MLFERNQALLAKIETTPGTDAIPVAASNAVASGVVGITIDSTEINSITIKNSISASPTAYSGHTATLSIPVELKGSGTAGTAPEISPLLQCCACKETKTDSAVSYAPVNSAASMKTSTIYLYRDGLCFKIVGCSGNFILSCPAGEYAVITFNIQGKVASIADAANPTGMVYQSVNPVEVKNYGFAFGEWEDAVARDFGFETGNTVSARKNINAVDGLEPFFVTARNPLWNSNIEAVLEATNSFWSDFQNRDTVTLGFTHGSTSGNIIEFEAPAANFDAPGMSSEDSINMYALSGQMLESDGEDNFTLTFK